MLTAIFIGAMVFVSSALAKDDERVVHQQLFRIAAVGTAFTEVRGHFVPRAPPKIDGVPAYEFQTTLAGIPLEEREFVNFRCNQLDDFYLVHSDNSNHVLFCHRLAPRIEGAPEAEDMHFIFSAEDLPISPHVKEIYFSLGRRLWKWLIYNHPGGAYTDKFTETEVNNIFRWIQGKLS